MSRYYRANRTIGTPIPPIMRGLAAEATKYGSFKDFEKAFLGQIKHGMYWHITDDADFTIDAEKGPRDMSSMGGGGISPGALMISSHLENWAETYWPDRKYAALIDMSDVPKSAYQQVSRGFGNEFYVDDPSKAHVIGVFHMKDALRINMEHHGEKPDSSEKLRSFYDAARTESRQPHMDAESLKQYYKHTTPEEWDREWEEDWKTCDECGGRECDCGDASRHEKAGAYASVIRMVKFQSA